MRESFHIGEIVNAYYFYMWVVDKAAVTHTSDASETVDGYFLHCFLAN
jgi:hypothetical protein